MKMNINKLFDAAAAAGIAPFEARITAENKISVSTFNTEIENFTVAENGGIKIRGLKDGKCGVFTSDRVDDEVIDLAIKSVAESAEFGQPVDPEFFIGGGEKYEKAETFNAKLAKSPASRFIELAKTISEIALALDKRVELASVQVEYSYGSTTLKNSNGLDVFSEMNFCMIFGSCKAKSGENVESGSHYEILSTLDGFDADDFARKLVADAIGRLGGASVASGKYKVVYSQGCAAALMSAFGSAYSAFNLEQHISLLEGKIGKKVFSENLTVEQTPIGKDPFCQAFDAEGVPCRNGLLIDKGVPTGFVYDLATAKRAGVKSTGNGRLEGGNVRPAVEFVTVKSGERDLEKLFEFVGDGLYIDDLGGVATGINGQSGDYSLQAAGYVIEGGKLTRPVSLITVASNILKDFANITAVGSDEKLTYYGIKTPSLAVTDISVSGVNGK